MTLTEKEVRKRLSDSYELPNKVRETAPEPLVTVRTSTYQHVSFIEKCIEGVLMQETDFPFEFIIGEDYSTDGTREIVFNYAEKYPEVIRVVTADYNVGAKVNGLRCIKKSRGKYMALCEGDDYWTDPQKLQKQADFMEGNTEFVLCYHRFQHEKEGILSNPVPKKGKDFTSDELIKSPSGIATATKFFKMVNKKGQGFFSTDYGGDYFFTAFLGSYGHCKFIDDISPSVRKWHSGGMWTSKSDVEKLFASINAKYKTYKFYREKKDYRRALIAIEALQDILVKKHQLTQQKGVVIYKWGARFSFMGVFFVFDVARLLKKVKHLFD